MEKLRAAHEKIVWFDTPALPIHDEPGRVLVHLVDDAPPLSRPGRKAN